MKKIRIFYECPNCGNIQTDPLGKYKEGEEKAGVAFVCACCEQQYKSCHQHSIKTDKRFIDPWGVEFQ